MSTRANIVIQDEYSKLWFYRHCDGYPSGTLPTLKKFCDYVTGGLIRDNAMQASGWLILIGAEENGEYMAKTKTQGYTMKKKKNLLSPNGEDSFMGWKCGAYEPTTRQHEDIEFLYTVDLKARTLTVKGIYTKQEITVGFDAIDIDGIEKNVGYNE